MDSRLHRRGQNAGWQRLTRQRLTRQRPGSFGLGAHKHWKPRSASSLIHTRILDRHRGRLNAAFEMRLPVHTILSQSRSMSEIVYAMILLG
jgi:hypothetical protein